MTSAPADWTRWLILVLISVIIAVAGQPVPSAAAASIACAMAGAASRRPRGHDNWRLVMLPPSDDARRTGIAGARSVSSPRGAQSTTAPERIGPDHPPRGPGLAFNPVPVFPDPQVPSLIAPPRRGRRAAASRRPCQPARGART